MKLVIVESPKKCETIGHYLGPDYLVKASLGHICDLSTHGKGGLGIDIEHDFKPDFVIVEGKAKVVNELKKLTKKADEVILATDPDREGEAISYHLAKALNLDIPTTKRLQFHEITKPAIEEAITHPGVIDMNLVNAQETRRMYDRIIGFKLSALLNKKINSPSAGRVQSVALKMIVDNDEEIKAFVPEEYWVITVDILVGDKVLTLQLDKVDGKNPAIKSEEEAKAIINRIGKALTLVSLSTVTKKQASRPAFTTSTMQQEAFNRFRFSTSVTQALAQQLYEGVAIKGEQVGLITYMRTDSTRISDEFYNHQAAPYIKSTFGPAYLGSNTVRGRKGRIQDAHEAIRPTSVERTPEEVKPYLDYNSYRLYTLIYNRAIASLMSDKVYESTTALFDSNGLTFKVVGTKTTFPGYEKIYREEEENDTVLPDLKERESYDVKEPHLEQKFTKAPARYSEAKVVKLMEEKGIGRPSTYASTIRTLIARKYVKSDKGILTPTESGTKTTIVLTKYFPEIVSTEYTAQMETKLDEIEEGKEDRVQAMKEFYYPFIEKFNEVSQKMYKDPLEETGEMCPVCGSPLVKRKNRYGKTFIGCSAYPKCTYIKKEETPVEYTGKNCPLCGSPLVKRVNKKGQTFVACSAYPTCHYIEGNEHKEKKVYTEKDYVKPCPSCKDGHLVLRHGKKADFLGCTNFPKCRYHEWLKDDKKKDEN